MLHLIMSPQVHKDTSDIRVVERSFAHVAESGRLRPSGAAGASFFGGAVWGVFRENINCGDPPE